MAANSKTPETQDKQQPHSGLHNLVFFGCVAVLSLLFVFFVARLAFVYGPSMENTLQERDVLLVWQLGYTPQPGDVIVTKVNEHFGVRLTKRVIAVEGQHIRIQPGSIELNGVPLQEPYVKEPGWNSPNIELTVPEGEVFLMGDNRNHSTDSREIGCVPRSEIMGKVVLHS